MCIGPLEAPTFEGSAELSSAPSDIDAALAAVSPSTATEAVRRARAQGLPAVGAYDFAPFSSASANFSFTTDDCVSEGPIRPHACCHHQYVSWSEGHFASTVCLSLTTW